ncbi:MATE family efflux transporter [Kiloniella sp. b19]|uniref:MATE family efflux transporter n=1 Tax=Kiloniella sp. GXU_MW_B19 TaxID=3141326 RepID=UPI0031E03307
MATEDENSMIVNGPVGLFVRFALPSTLGMLAISSASIIDGIFVGNYVGADALAALSLTAPFFGLVFGVLIMLAVGSAVIAGQHVGEGRQDSANDVFSQALVFVLMLFALLACVLLLFPEQVVRLFGARGGLLDLSAEYVWVLGWFLPVLAVDLLLSHFLRVDGRPGLVLAGMMIPAVGNVALDYILIAWFELGVTGAALATGLSYVFGLLIMLSHFLSARARLRFVRPSGSFRSLVQASRNGFSEFLNESSGGLIVFLFNWILIVSIGTEGVAAFTIVNYMLFLGVLLFYGVSEGVVPLISVNHGAGKFVRTRSFLNCAIVFNLACGMLLAAILFLWPRELISLFLEREETEGVVELAVEFTRVVWFLFLLNGISIAVSAYFTGTGQAGKSALIAFARALFLPVALIALFWQIWGYMGAFYALPLAEFATLLLCFVLLRKKSRSLLGAEL